MNYKTLLLTVISLNIIGCAAIAPEPSEAPIPSSITSGSWDKLTKSELLIKQLTRTHQHNYLDKVTAMLYSDALIEAQEVEIGAKNLETADIIRKNILERKSQLTNGKTCFLIDIKADSIHVATFINWKAKLQVANNELLDVHLENTKGVGSVPSYSGYSFYNVTSACSFKKIDTTKPFSLILIPQFKRETIKLSWLVDQPPAILKGTK